MALVERVESKRLFVRLMPKRKCRVPFIRFILCATRIRICCSHLCSAHCPKLISHSLHETRSHSHGWLLFHVVLKCFISPISKLQRRYGQLDMPLRFSRLSRYRLRAAGDLLEINNRTLITLKNFAENKKAAKSFIKCGVFQSNLSCLFRMLIND